MTRHTWGGAQAREPWLPALLLFALAILGAALIGAGLGMLRAAAACMPCELPPCPEVVSGSMRAGCILGGVAVSGILGLVWWQRR